MSEAEGRSVTPPAGPHDPTDPRDPELVPGPRKVLIAVDGSHSSDYALQWYVANLHKEGHTVIVIHSFEMPFLHSYQEMYVAPEMWQATLHKEADKAVALERKTVAYLGQYGIKCRFIGRGGKPGEVIIKAAEEEDVDVIVTGSRGHTKMHRVLMGSVSNYVMHHAHCPVTVCRPKLCEHDHHQQHGHKHSHKKHSGH